MLDKNEIGISPGKKYLAARQPYTVSSTRSMHNNG